IDKVRCGGFGMKGVLKLDQASFEFRGRTRRSCRDGESEQNAGEGGMDPGMMQGQPKQYAQDAVWNSVPDSAAVQEEQQKKDCGGEADGVQADLVGVEEGDHENGAQIIGDGQGGQKDDQAWGNPPG